MDISSHCFGGGAQVWVIVAMRSTPSPELFLCYTFPFDEETRLAI